MPITINGTGTVAGLTAGGLPDGCVATADIADANVTPAKLSQPLTLATAKAFNWNGSSSNTVLDFESIPSWAKRVTVIFSGVSTNGTSQLIIQIGDSGGVEATGYESRSSYIYQGAQSTAGYTTGFGINAGAATNALSGMAQLFNITANTWICTLMVGSPDAGTNGFIPYGTGVKTLSGTLDRVRITTINGTDTFDAGSVNIMYEG